MWGGVGPPDLRGLKGFMGSSVGTAIPPARAQDLLVANTWGKIRRGTENVRKKRHWRNSICFPSKRGLCKKSDYANIHCSKKGEKLHEKSWEGVFKINSPGGGGKGFTQR